MAPKMKIESAQPSVAAQAPAATPQKAKASASKASAPKAPARGSVSDIKPRIASPTVVTKTTRQEAPAKPATAASPTKRSAKVVVSAVEDAQPTVGSQESQTRARASEPAGEAPAAKAAVQPRNDAGEPAQGEASAGRKGFFGAADSVGNWVSRSFPGHEHAFWGAVLAIVVALLVFAIGIWRVLFIAVLVFVGIAVGQLLDGDPKIIAAIRDLITNDRGQE